MCSLFTLNFYNYILMRFRQTQLGGLLTRLKVTQNPRVGILIMSGIFFMIVVSNFYELDFGSDKPQNDPR